MPDPGPDYSLLKQIDVDVLQVACPAPRIWNPQPMADGSEDIARAPLNTDVEYVDEMAAGTYALRPPRREDVFGVGLASC